MLKFSNVVKKKIIIEVALALFWAVLWIGLASLICFLAQAVGPIYFVAALAAMLVSGFSYWFVFHGVILKLYENEMEKIETRVFAISKEELMLKLTAIGFTQIADGLTYYKSYDAKRKNAYKRYLLITDGELFDLAVEQLLLTIQKFDNASNEYFEAYVFMFHEDCTNCSEEIAKESRADSYVFSNIYMHIDDKLFKCIIYDKNGRTVSYYKKAYDFKSENATKFIEEELLKETL